MHTRGSPDVLDAISSPFSKGMQLTSPVPEGPCGEGQHAGNVRNQRPKQFQFPPLCGPSRRKLVVTPSMTPLSDSEEEVTPVFGNGENEDPAETSGMSFDSLLTSSSTVVPWSSASPAPSLGSVDFGITTATRTIQLPPVHPGSARANRRSRADTSQELYADTFGGLCSPDDPERTSPGMCVVSSPLPSRLASPPLPPFSQTTAVPIASFKRSRDAFSPDHDDDVRRSKSAAPDVFVSQVESVNALAEACRVPPSREPAGCVGLPLTSPPGLDDAEAQPSLLPTIPGRNQMKGIDPSTVSTARRLLPVLFSICPGADAFRCLCGDFAQVARLLDGDFADTVDRFVIVDCRFPYEFEGGHIRGAVHAEDFAADLQQQYFSHASLAEFSSIGGDAPVEGPDSGSSQTEDGKRKSIVFIFHCEFSQSRGPKL